MSYKEKLEQFNSTEKYQKELDFLYGLFGNDFNKVLDYGCGNLFSINKFNKIKNCFVGYDVNVFAEGYDYADKLGKYDIVYFLHSIAHIKGIETVLKLLDTKIICVITPNKEWLDVINNNSNYKPDTTVIRHFTQYELIELFKDSGYEIITSGSFGEVSKSHNERLFIKAIKIK